MNSVLISGLRQGFCRLQHVRMLCLHLAKSMLLLFWEWGIVGTIQLFVMGCDYLGSLLRRSFSRLNDKGPGPGLLLYPACFQQRPRGLENSLEMIPLTQERASRRRSGKRSEIL